MDLGNRLLTLRKQKGLSQEEVADRLGVSRQTISKWETDQSLPDFDKILPLCELFDITSDELLGGKTSKKDATDAYEVNDIDRDRNRQKRAQYISSGLFLYFLAVALFMLPVGVLDIDPTLSIPIFIIICGAGTYMLVYGNIVYKKVRIKKNESSRLMRPIIGVITMIATVVYFLVSFTTFAWHISWLIWIIYAAVVEIVRLIFVLKEGKDEE